MGERGRVGREREKESERKGDREREGEGDGGRDRGKSEERGRDRGRERRRRGESQEEKKRGGGGEGRGRDKRHSWGTARGSRKGESISATADMEKATRAAAQQSRRWWGKRIHTRYERKHTHAVIQTASARRARPADVRDGGGKEKQNAGRGQSRTQCNWIRRYTRTYTGWAHAAPHSASARQQ